MRPTAATTKTAAGSGITILLAAHLPLLAALTTCLLLAMFLGVVLPAVWSTKPGRRGAALSVLREILKTTGRRPRS